MNIAYRVSPERIVDHTYPLNVFDTLEDANIWINGWYMEDCYLYKILYHDTDLIEEVTGTVELDNHKIVAASWKTLNNYISSCIVFKITYIPLSDSRRRNSRPEETY